MDGVDRPVRVYWVLAIGIAGFAISPILVRFAEAAPGGALAVWRTVFAVVLLAPFAIRPVSAEIRAFSLREGMLIVLSGVVLGFHFITWIESLYHTSVASASTLVTTSPIFLAIAGYFILKESLSMRVWIAIFTAVMGSTLIAWGDAGDEYFPRALLGNSLALLAALLVTVYMLIGRVIRRKTSWISYVFPLYVVVACTTLTFAALRSTPLVGYDWEIYGWCLAMAIGPQIIGHGSVNYALKYFPAALIALLALCEPVFASIIAFFLFGELPRALALIGMVVVLTSIAAALFEPLRAWLRAWGSRVEVKQPTREGPRKLRQAETRVDP